MFHMTLLDSLLIVLAVSIGVIGLIHRFRLSPILGYLLVGMLIGPGGLGWVHDEEDIHLLGELGVVFLLFTIGLEFSLPRLLADSKAVLGVGGLQVVLTTLVFALIAWGLGLPLPADIVIGGALAMSSTAMVVALLAEQHEIASRHGRQAVGILLFQDLSAMFFLMMIPALAGERPSSLDIAIPLVKGAFVLMLLFLAGRWVLRPLFRKVAALHSPELFMLSTLLASLGTARFAHLSGFSPALGGFMAGMVLGETEFRHQVEADIRPFQDVLLGLFFISVGMQVDLPLLLQIWPAVLMVAGGILVGKAAIVTAIARLAGLPLSSALRTGVVLAQAGEFSLVLLSLGLQEGILQGEIGQTILFAVLLTMALTPLLVRFNASIAQQFCAVSLRRTRATIVEQVEEIGGGLEDHVILCGYGRVGQNVARFLDERGFPYMALDLDPQRVRLAREMGEPVSYGNATRRMILQAAGIGRA
ncbi:MAG: potassium transporter KefB, partial [Gammaproteobacteria bacterium]